MLQWGGVLIAAGTTSLLLPVIMHMSVQSLVSILLIMSGIILISIKLQSLAQHQFAKLKQTILDNAKDLVLDEVSLKVVKQFNETFVGGGIASVLSSFGVWFLYTFPFTEEQRLQLMHSFALSDEDENVARDVMFSPGGAFRYFLCDSPTSQQEGGGWWDRLLVQTANTQKSNTENPCHLEADMEWETDIKELNLVERTRGEESSVSIDENSVPDEKNDNTTSSPTMQSSTVSSQVDSLTIQEDQNITRQTPLNPTPMVIEQDQNSEEDSNISINENHTTSNTANLYISSSNNLSPEQTLYRIFSQIVHNYIHSSSFFSSPERMQLSSHIPINRVQQISVLSTLLLCTHVGMSRTARKSLSRTLHGLTIGTCLSVSVTSSILYGILKREKDQNWDYKKIAVKYILSILSKQTEIGHHTQNQNNNDFIYDHQDLEKLHQNKRKASCQNMERSACSSSQPWSKNSFQWILQIMQRKIGKEKRRNSIRTKYQKMQSMILWIAIMLVIYWRKKIQLNRRHVRLLR